MSLPSHHILCAGPYTVPFARLAAESALASCPESMRKGLRLHIHLDSILWWHRNRIRRWLSEVPGVEVTYGLFGIRPGDKIPGKWHQRMVNKVAQTFSSEPHVAFIDADFFIADAGWWQACEAHTDADLYALSVGLRTNRHMRIDSKTLHPIKTHLFSLQPEAHCRWNTQTFTRDMASAEQLVRDYPQAEIELGKGLDSMVIGSLIAQAQGMRVLDVEPLMTGCHVGGFSHIKKSKLTGDNRVPQELDNWLARLRLINRVLGLMQARGWTRFIESGHRKRVAQATAFVKSTPQLSERQQALPPTSHEQAFEQVLKILPEVQA